MGRKGCCPYPDAAVTSTEEWDAFGLMEINPEEYCNERSQLLDNDKCILMTAATAMVIKEYITERDYAKV